jgi:hypothetical protein
MGLYGRGTRKDLHKMEHTGRIQHRQRTVNEKEGDHKPQNIVCYILTSIDDSARYKMINGKLYTEDVNFADGHHSRERKWILIEEHNAKHYPILQNPLNEIDHSMLKTRDEILK